MDLSSTLNEILRALLALPFTPQSVLSDKRQNKSARNMKCVMCQREGSVDSHRVVDGVFVETKRKVGTLSSLLD